MFFIVLGIIGFILISIFFYNASLLKKCFIVIFVVFIVYLIVTFSKGNKKKRDKSSNNIQKKDPDGDIRIQNLPNGYIAFRPNKK